MRANGLLAVMFPPIVIQAPSAVLLKSLSSSGFQGGRRIMATHCTRITLLLAVGWLLLNAPTASAAPPEPCQILPAETWGSIMGYSATATPGDMNCTYESKTGGGQFRIIAVVGSSAEAEASVKRMRDHQPRGSHDPRLGVVDSQGTVVFSIALFQHAATDSTASQLQKLVAAAKQHLSK
jgi:hypothetical protein